MAGVIQDSYTLLYNANGGTGAPDSITIDSVSIITLSSVIPTRDGYTFVEWNTNSNGNGTSYQPGDTYYLDADIILYAIWAAKVYTTADYLTQLQTDKQTLVDNLNAKGVEATNTETFTSLVPKVANIKVDSSGTILTAEDIANNPTEYYGMLVSYEVEDSALQATLDSLNIGWQIFYAGSDYTTTGSNHIYLIASDYVPRTCLPASSAGNSLNESSSYARAAYFTNILNDYTGSASVTSSELKKLNNSYFNKGYSSTSNNWKSVAYMMDTSISVWGKYANSKYADYAIGGPPIEMIMKSYSQKYNNGYTARAEDSTGYKISKDGSTYTFYCDEMLSASDSTYVINSKTNASTLWVASPSSLPFDSCTMRVDYNGYVGACSCNSDGTGFRPLVCLSSDVKIKIPNQDVLLVR